MYPKSQVVWIFWVVWTFSATFEILFNYEWGDLKLESTLGEVVFFIFFFNHQYLFWDGEVTRQTLIWIT